MEQPIIFRAVIEVLGKPKEHVEKALGNYIENLNQDERYSPKNVDLAEAKEQKESDYWSTFAEVEIEAKNSEDLISFCFEYMPSMIEIIEPQGFPFDNTKMSVFLNDLQAKLHQVDMVAKQMKMERDFFRKSFSDLLKNYITVLLKKGDLTGEQLSKLTGIGQDQLEDFLDKLIDEGKIDLKDNIYYIKEEPLQNG